MRQRSECGKMQLLAHIPDIDGFHILYLFHVGEIEIGHTDLLPFIQKRCSPQGRTGVASALALSS